LLALLVIFFGGLAVTTQTPRWTAYTFADMINMYLDPLLKSPSPRGLDSSSNQGRRDLRQ